MGVVRITYTYCPYVCYWVPILEFISYTNKVINGARY
jgi:hypothetical protein